jgi:hypothetical protein
MMRVVKPCCLLSRRPQETGGSRASSPSSRARRGERAVTRPRMVGGGGTVDKSSYLTMTSVECHHTSAPDPTQFQYLYYGSLLRRSHTSASNQHLLPTQTSPAPPSITVIMKFAAILTILAATAAIAAPVGELPPCEKYGLCD